MKRKLLGILLVASLVLGNVVPTFAEPTELSEIVETEDENHIDEGAIGEERAENSVSEDSVSEDFVSEDSVSEDSVSEDSVGEDLASLDEIMQELSFPVDHYEPISIKLTDEQEKAVQKLTAENEIAAESVQYNSKWDRYTSYYVYNQLPKEKRMLWDYWTDQCDNYLYGAGKAADIPCNELDSKSGEHFYYFAYYIDYDDAFSSYQEMSNMLLMFRYTHPQYYFLRSVMIGNQENGIALTVYPMFVSGSNRSAATAQMDQAISEYYDGIDGKTGEELVRYFYEEEINKVEYNHSSVATSHAYEDTECTQSAYSTFILKNTVCAGYTMALSLLLNGQNIESMGVTSDGHAWTKAKVNGAWYNLDSTWGDQSFVYYACYLKSSSTFQDTSLDSDNIYHVEESFWNPYLPPCTHDSVTTDRGKRFGGIDDVSGAAETPVITLSGNKASISAAGCDRIYYSINTEEAPTSSSSKSYVYESSVEMVAGDIIKAIAVKDGYNDSSVASWTHGSIRQTVTYVLNGGTNPSGNITSYIVKNGAEFTLLSPTKTGYTFDGWYTTESFDPGSKVSKLDLGNEDGYTLYAKWTPKSYTVTLNANGGTINGKTTVSKTVTYTEEVGTLDVPVYSGYEFAGWFTAKNGGTEITSDTIYDVPGNSIYYAHWNAKSYTLTLDANGGNFEGGSETITKSVVYGASYGEMEIPVKTGYTFLGYSETPGSTSYINKDSLVNETDDHTLYANWKAITYKIHYDANGAAGSMTDTIAVYDVDAVLKNNAFTNAGYDFVEWNTQAAGGGDPYAAGETVRNLCEDQDDVFTLYAVWGPKQYQLSLNANDGEFANGEISKTVMVEYLDQIGTLENPTREGYDFAGWYDAKTGGNAITEETEYTWTSNYTIYARWTAKQYEITLNANGGSFDNEETIAVINCIFGEAYGDMPVPHLDGYAFIGYYTDAEDGDKITSTKIFNDPEATVLYAHWNEVEENGVIIAGSKVNIRDRFGTTDLIAKYMVSNKKLGSITSSGVFSAKAAGDVTVTAYTKVGKTYVPVESVDLHIEKPIFKFNMIAVSPGEQIDASTFITGTEEIPYRYTISGKVATIDENGMITVNQGLKSGTVKVTVYFDANVSPAKYTASLKVKIPTMSFQSATMKTETAKVLKLKGNFNPVTFVSEDESVATVDPTGKITAVGIGKTTIKAKLDGYDYEYVCPITVIYSLKKVMLTADNWKLSLSAEDTAMITMVASPFHDDIGNEWIVWKSSRPSVATVEDGIVIPHCAGSTTITATVMGKKASITIKVVP